MFNDTTTLPNGPSATFSSPLITISYTPAGLGYNFHHILLRLLVRFQSLFLHPYVYMLLGSIVFSMLIYHLHRRLISLETAPPHPITSEHVKRLLAIQRTTILALTTTQSTIEEHFTALSSILHQVIEGLDEAISSNLYQMDTDIATLSSRSKYLQKQARILERNLDVARELLGAGVELSADDGLEMGDEMETFWPRDVLDGDEEGVDEGDGDEEEEIDVEKSNEMVWAWTKRCAWPEECLDA